MELEFVSFKDFEIAFLQALNCNETNFRVGKRRLGMIYALTKVTSEVAFLRSDNGLMNARSIQNFIDKMSVYIAIYQILGYGKWISEIKRLHLDESHETNVNNLKTFFYARLFNVLTTSGLKYIETLTTPYKNAKPQPNHIIDTKLLVAKGYTLIDVFRIITITNQLDQLSNRVIILETTDPYFNLKEWRDILFGLYTIINGELGYAVETTFGKLDVAIIFQNDTQSALQISFTSSHNRITLTIPSSINLSDSCKLPNIILKHIPLDNEGFLKKTFNPFSQVNTQIEAELFSLSIRQIILFLNQHLIAKTQGWENYL